MNKKSIVIAVVLIGAISIAGGILWSAESNKIQGKRETKAQAVAMTSPTKISTEQAIKTAVENFPGKVMQAQLEKKDDRTLWEVEILTEEQGTMMVWVDADSGAVVTTEEKGERTSHDPEKKR